MKVSETKLPGVLLFEPRIFGDERGFFMESFNAQRYAEHGLPELFVQDNVSYSQRGVLRGLHFQNPQAQGKLVGVLEGEVFDVAVDIRLGSPTFGEWFGTHLSAENKKQIYVPPDFAHGFLVTSRNALFTYKCTDYYAPDAEGSILWNDPDIGVEWPFGDASDVKLSGKDRAAPKLSETPEGLLPTYR